jgi:hypothetical protein
VAEPKAIPLPASALPIPKPREATP